LEDDGLSEQIRRLNGFSGGRRDKANQNNAKHLTFFVKWFALNIILRSTRNTLEPHSRWSQPNIVPKRAQSFYQCHLLTEPLRLESFFFVGFLNPSQDFIPVFSPRFRVFGQQ